VLHDASVYVRILGLSGQLSGDFDLGRNSPGRSESSNNASMVLGLRSTIGYECATQIDRGRLW
jgi:hypothetical protein